MLEYYVCRQFYLLYFSGNKTHKSRLCLVVSGITNKPQNKSVGDIWTFLEKIKDISKYGKKLIFLFLKIILF